MKKIVCLLWIALVAMTQANRIDELYVSPLTTSGGSFKGHFPLSSTQVKSSEKKIVIKLSPQEGCSKSLPLDKDKIDVEEGDVTIDINGKSMTITNHRYECPPSHFTLKFNRMGDDDWFITKVYTKAHVVPEPQEQTSSWQERLGNYLLSTARVIYYRYIKQMMPIF